MTDQPSPRSRQNALLASAIVLCAFAITAFPLIAIQYDRGDKAYDQRMYHVPAIDRFADEFPNVNLHDYSSATSPGFHLAVAIVDRYVSNHISVIRFFGSLFTIVLLGILAMHSGDRLGPMLGVAVVLPMVFSIYVFCSGVWLLPDNAGWIFVLLLILLALREEMDARTFVAVAILLALGEFTRQTVLLALAPLLVAAVLQPSDRRRKVGMLAISALPGLAVLGWLAMLWGGLTPPSFQTFELGQEPPGHSGWMHEGPNFATPALIFAIVGFFAPFFCGLIFARVREIWNDSIWRKWIFIGAVIGLLSATIPETYTLRPERISGLWMIAMHFPSIAGRSIFMLGMATLGGALLAGWIAAIPSRREQWIILSAWIAFIIVQSANAMAWQKYSEPFVLMMMVLMLTRLGMVKMPIPRWSLAGPVILTLIQIALTIDKLELLM